MSRTIRSPAATGWVPGPCHSTWDLRTSARGSRVDTGLRQRYSSTFAAAQTTMDDDSTVDLIR